MILCWRCIYQKEKMISVLIAMCVGKNKSPLIYRGGQRCKYDEGSISCTGL